MHQARAVILLMAHGTPDSLEQMPEYLTRVRNGRPPSPELVDEIRANYAAIGGRSPLTDITVRQGAALQALLGPGVRVLVGMRNWHPFIADVLAEMGRASSAPTDTGERPLDVGAALAPPGAGPRQAPSPHADRVIGIPLAPQFSTVSVQKYVEVARAAMPAGVGFSCVPSFHAHPLLIEAFAERVRAARPADDEDVIFTAHSLPVRVAESGDPYPSQVADTAAAVARRSGIVSYHRAYQSAGRTPEPWLGPDIAQMIRDRSASGVRRFLVVPIGFVCDHTEILFDIDVQAARVARECGAALRRTESLNASPAFIRLLAALVEDAMMSWGQAPLFLERGKNGA